jgi:hypothetical protein
MVFKSLKSLSLERQTAEDGGQRPCICPADVGVLAHMLKPICRMNDAQASHCSGLGLIHG